ncbi:hypothetical protein ANCCAN_13127 [Ancylostoma caninum]|uniref:Uncharacterized protein n=1 Tax=Ancylostoma caninum TaxID=29170 RepID=A0A368GD29_ANCCA|nr:hypothetical protein ANCCAN_13127 [Ancylostoma caninum]
MSAHEDAIAKRINAFQENVNKKTLIDWVRITGLVNPGKRKLDRLLDDFARDILKYPREHPTPFSWPTTAGYYGNCMAIRTRMTYHFWRFFMQEGRKTLYEYNRRNGAEIKINREKTITLQDQDRMGLFIRKYIRAEYNKVNKKGVDVTMRKGLLKIGEHPPMKPSVIAVLLDINLKGRNQAWVYETT